MNVVTSGVEAIERVRTYLREKGSAGAEIQMVARQRDRYWVVAFQPDGEFVFGGTLYWVDEEDGAVYPVSGSYPPTMALREVEEQRRARKGG